MSDQLQALAPAPMPDVLDASWLADHAGRAEQLDTFAQAVQVRRSVDWMRTPSKDRPPQHPPPRPPVPGELAGVDSGPLADWAAAHRELGEAMESGSRAARMEATRRESELRTYAEEAWGQARPAIDAYREQLAAWAAGPMTAEPADDAGTPIGRW